MPPRRIETNIPQNRTKRAYQCKVQIVILKRPRILQKESFSTKQQVSLMSYFDKNTSLKKIPCGLLKSLYKVTKVRKRADHDSKDAGRMYSSIVTLQKYDSVKYQFNYSVLAFSISAVN